MIVNCAICEREINTKTQSYNTCHPGAICEGKDVGNQITCYDTRGRRGIDPHKDLTWQSYGDEKAGVNNYDNN